MTFLPVDDEADEAQHDESFELSMHNAASFDGFVQCATQWRVAGAGMAGLIFIGLDYAGCKVMLDHMRSPAHVFTDLRAIEDHVLPILNARDDTAETEADFG